jgi:hypothetical protein
LICDPSNGEQVKQSVVKKNEAELRGIKPNDIKNYHKKTCSQIGTGLQLDYESF